MGFRRRRRPSRHLPHNSHSVDVGYLNGGVKSRKLGEHYLPSMERVSKWSLKTAFEALECLFWHYVIKEMTFQEETGHQKPRMVHFLHVDQSCLSE